MKIAVFTLVLWGSFGAWAQSTGGKDYVVSPSKSEVIEQDSSAHHRVDKKYQVVAQLTGVGPSLTGGQGIQAGYHLERNKLVLVEFTSGSLTSTATASSSLSTDTSGSKYDIKSQSFGVHYKQFTGNSFYWRAGADYRTLKYKYTFSSTGFADDTRDFDGTSLAANFQIGNQWQWQNFTLGCDWIGYALPLTSQVSNDKVVSSTPTYDRDRLNEDSKLLVKNGHITLLRFYLGASF